LFGEEAACESLIDHHRYRSNRREDDFAWYEAGWAPEPADALSAAFTMAPVFSVEVKSAESKARPASSGIPHANHGGA
jgi:hypothetical protein